MTLPGTIAAATPATPPERAVWRAEIIETIKLAWPIALTQLGQIAMMTTDLALIGRLGDGAIAAVGLAHLILFVGFVLGMGPVSAVAPLAAQAFGARDPRMVRRSLRVGLWAAVMLGVPINVAQLWGEDILITAGQSSAAAALAARYLTGLAWSMIPAWCFIALRNFMGAVNRPEPALWVTIAAIPVNGLLAYALINGAFGAPRLDLLGAGLATTLVNVAMCAAAIWICYTCRPFKKYRVLGRFWRADWDLLQQLIAIGLPISGALMLEWGLFASAALLMGWIGAIALGAALMVAMTAIVVAFHDAIPMLFLGDDSGGNAATARLAATLLLVGASFFVTDGMQTIAAGALRGLNDTRVPMWFAAVSFWLIGFTCVYGLAFPGRLGAVGIWIGFSIAIATFAPLLIYRFHVLTLPKHARGRTKDG